MTFPARLLLVLGISLMAPASFGAPHAIDLRVAPLNLKNGHSYPDATLKTYDPATGGVVVVADKAISALQIELFPDDLADRIRSLVPPEPAPTPPPAATATPAPEERQPDQWAQARADAARHAQEWQAKAAQQRVEAARLAKVRSIKQAAAQRAWRYFRYEYRIGSGYTCIIRREAEVEEPEEVAGWSDRYRVRGSIGVEYRDSVGRSFGTQFRKFEALIQGDDKGNMTAVDIAATN